MQAFPFHQPQFCVNKNQVSSFIDKSTDMKHLPFLTAIFLMLISQKQYGQAVSVSGALYSQGSSGSTPVSGAGVRMMWVPSKKAFRAGEVTGSEWDNDFIGDHSFAVGNVNTASGLRSFAGGGQNNFVSGNNSFIGAGDQNTVTGTNAFIGGGFSNVASHTWSFVGGGYYDTASAYGAFVGGGWDNKASGDFAFSGGGYANTANGPSAFIGGGENNKASGHYSFVGGGLHNVASSPSAFVAGGYYNVASANDAFIGGGLLNKASGKGSFTGGGSGLRARSYGEAVFGFNNTDYVPLSSTTFDPNDRLFVIGNGPDSMNRRNAVTVLKNGKIGIGTDNPLARLTMSDGALLIAGSTGGTPVAGAGTRFMWIPEKKAFRAGEVTGSHWDNDSIGHNSFVTGKDNIASGQESSAVGGSYNVSSGQGSYVCGGQSNTASAFGAYIGGGLNNTASGFTSGIGGGFYNAAPGHYSFIGGGEFNVADDFYSCIAGGTWNIASGISAFVGGGEHNTASGNASFAGGGKGLLAKSYGEVVVGIYNTNYTPASGTDFVSGDRLFVIGNGQDSLSRSNAMTVLKNGNIGIGNTQPSEKLHISGGDLRVDGGEFQSWGPIVFHPDVDNGGDDMIRFLNSAGGETMRLSEAGSLGIGRIPTTNKLEVEGDASKTAPGDWIGNSDARLKKNVIAMNPEETLQKMLNLKGVTFEWNDTATGSKRPEGVQYGFTAQNIREVFPSLVSEDHHGFLQTAYGTYDAMLVEALRALNNKYTAQQEIIVQLSSELSKLQLYTLEIEKRLHALELQQ